MALVNAFGAIALEDTLQDVRDGISPVRTQFDYYTPAGSSLNQIRYMGIAVQGTANNAATWIVRRFSHQRLGTEDKITDIQVLTGSWDNRATLLWS